MVGELHPLRNHGYIRELERRQTTIRRDCSYSRITRERNETPRVRLIELSHERPEEDIARELVLNDGELAWCVRVVRYRNKIPASMSDQWIPESVAPNLESCLGDGLSTHAALSAFYGIRPQRVHSEVTATAADHGEARALQVPLHFPLLRIHSLNCDVDRKPVEVSRTRIRSDLVSVVVTPV
jgi:DNA-binding GntR family transcriptional regulator